MDAIDIVKSYLDRNTHIGRLRYKAIASVGITNLGMSTHCIAINDTWLWLHVAEHGIIIAKLYTAKKEIPYSDPEFGNKLRQYVQEWITRQQEIKRAAHSKPWIQST